MESPNYAKWIPEAGGYVHNGSIVSTTPLYDETGRQRVDVDLSQLQTPGSQANQTGSGVDNNANITNIGSMGSTALNTENSDYGVLNTPATRSTSAEEPVLSPVDQTLKDIAYHQAHNNLMGQINGYTTLQQQTGQDYSQMINNLHQQRNKKITDQDNAYGQAITEAYISGDYAKVQQLQQEQADWRANVGFGETQKVEYQMQKDNLQEQYNYAYLTGLNDIGNSLSSMFGGLNDALMSGVNQLINFQYNPQTDMNLQLAQGYAVGAVKEQMNHTGMYYSSMTQSAITRAVAELVPVYEKMAKDEMKENIQMLMSVGNYLMNLEQTQFNLWKGQIDVQLALNQEKRNEYKDALERANAWGYVSNEDAVILGVAPGSPSPQALQEARKAQAELDKEQRDLYSKLVLADYENTLAIQKMAEEKSLDNYYKQQQNYQTYQYDISKQNNKAYLDSLLESQKHTNDIELQNLKHVGDMELQALKKKAESGISTDVSSILSNAGFSEETSAKMSDLINGNYTSKQTEKFFDDNKLTENSFAEYDAIIDKSIEAIKQNTVGPTNDMAFKKLYEQEKQKAIEEGNATLLNTYVSEKIIPEIDGIIENNFGEDYSKTTDTLKSALDKADEYASTLAKLNYDTKDDEIARIYENIVDEINGAGQFDYSWLNLHDDYNKLKKNAEDDIVKRIKNNKNLGDSAGRIAFAVETYIGNVQADLVDENGNYKKPNYRDDLINNTLRRADSMIGTAYNVGSNAFGTVVNNQAFQNAVNIAKNVGSRYLIGELQMPSGGTASVANYAGQKVGEKAGQILAENISKAIQSLSKKEG